MNIPEFDTLLQSLNRDSNEILASGLLTVDGIMVARHLPEGVSEDKLAGLSAAILSVGDKMITDLLGGITDRVMIQSSIGYVIVTAVSVDLLLAVIATPDAKLGMIFHDVKQVAKEIQYLQYGIST